MKRLEDPPTRIREFNDQWRKWFARISQIEQWQGVATFANSWANTGSPHYDAAYKQNIFGVVRLHGRIDSGSTGNAAFTLPAGYRPNATIGFAVSGGTVTISAAGVVTPTGTSLYLDGISFLAEA